MIRPLCLLLAAGTLNGCGWFDGWFGGRASPLQTAPLRPGVDKQTTVNGLPPAPNRGSYDAGVVPVDDNRTQPIGAIVAATGGQKAQLDKMEKERAQQDAEREKERAQREAERDRENKDAPKGAAPASPPAGPAPTAASDAAPAAVPAPPPAPEPEPSNPPAQR